MTRISRRGLLAGLVLTSAFGRSAAAGQSDMTETLLGLVSDRAKAAALGETWARQDGASATPDSVVNSLIWSLQQQGWTAGADTTILRTRYSAAVERDYSAGNVVTIQGWQLARTQADLCALAYYASAGLL